MSALVNEAVQLDGETQRHPCLNAPRGRGDQTGDINVPKSAEVASSLQEAGWLAERAGDMAFKGRGRCTGQESCSLRTPRRKL